MRASLLLVVACATTTARAWELNGRAEGFGVAQLLEEDDVQREVVGTPEYEGSADLRLMFRDSVAEWHLIADLVTLYEVGDQFAFISSPENTLDQTPRNDKLRFMDLTWTLDEGDRHDVIQRFDRLAVEYRAEHWGVTVGRDAVSWGSGIVFQPLDLFAPFAPTTVDRDYKNGEDMIKVDGVTDGGGDWQLLSVFRRKLDGERTTSVDAFGAKWHGAIGDTEYELIGGRNYEDYVFGVSARHAVDGAMARTDWLVTELDGGGTKVSGIANIDYSFTLFDRNAYVFGEYFHNGFGVDHHPIDLADLPQPLRDRLLRGELFTLMRDYTAVGARYEWHPLVTHTLTLLTNLHDGSNLVQTQLNYEPSDAQHIDLGYQRDLGHRGDEYGAIPLPPPATGLTTGGGSQWYLRWAYYW